ncbi:TPA: hypothetical protein ACM4BP_001726 [Escherichia coli]|uniref:hypothetical protein n=1 Tax=Escherichia coli TaxID=562 RepID=UPI002025AC30|nr:hypothetical protein [Escherichia coli]
MKTPRYWLNYSRMTRQLAGFFMHGINALGMGASKLTQVITLIPSAEQMAIVRCA